VTDGYSIGLIPLIFPYNVLNLLMVAAAIHCNRAV